MKATGGFAHESVFYLAPDLTDPRVSRIPIAVDRTLLPLSTELLSLRHRST